jgi:iron complex transport system substrate-binding protein
MATLRQRTRPESPYPAIISGCRREPNAVHTPVAGSRQSGISIGAIEYFSYDSDNACVHAQLAEMIADLVAQFPETQNYPRRIVCLTEETTETIYLLGEQDRIAGVSGYTARPPEARLKPRVSAFTTAKFDKILEVHPDLVLTFSDLQADLARELIRRGVPVVAFNQRTVSEILEMIFFLGRILGCEAKARSLVDRLIANLQAISLSASQFPRRPRVFFEEWKDPLISGIRWVEELIEIAGGEPLFPELKEAAFATDRIVPPDLVRERNPDVVIASWCGMKVNKDAIRSRPGWEAINAIRDHHIYEIKSTYILQPGPAALTEGVQQLHFILAKVCGGSVPSDIQPAERVDSALELRKSHILITNP